MAEPFRESDDKSIGARVVALSGRDLDDARRLLTLLTEASDADFLQQVPSGSEQVTTPQALLASARRELVERRRRRHHFPEGMFGEPAWEILLLLYIQKDERRFTVGQLAEALDLPQNSTGRWLKYLHSAGLARRRPHHLDQRAVRAEISEEGIKALEAYFSDRPGSTR